jgi:hypothetical protein
MNILKTSFKNQEIKLKISVLILVAFPFLTIAQNQCNDLLISEYLDGDNKNKVIEIYNPSEADVNLEYYSIKVFQNGAPTPLTIYLNGLINPNGTYVVSHPLASSEILSKADQTDVKLNFDGDDAIVLNKFQSTYIDKIGEIGVNPGNNGWNTNPNGSTKRHDLRRKFDVQSGELDWNQGRNQWVAKSKDSIGNIKIHQNQCRSNAQFEFALISSEHLESALNILIEVRQNGYETSSDATVYVDISSEGCYGPVPGGTVVNDLTVWTYELVFPGQQITSQYIDVTIWEDNTPEQDEYFCLDIWDFEGNVGFDHLHTLKIIDNDGLGLPNEHDNTLPFNVFPTNAQDEINIDQTTLNVNITKLRVLNSIGQTLVSKNSIKEKSTKLDISTLPKGIYFLNVITDKESY